MIYTIPLKPGSWIDLIDLIVVQQIIDDILLQSLAEQGRQSYDTGTVKPTDNPLFQLISMAAIGIAMRPHSRQLVAASVRVGIDVDGRDVNKFARFNVLQDVGK
jgi:hypothetical protein